VIGVTGAPAAGKSTVTSILAEAGCAVIDVDGLGHAALETPEVRDAVADEFGSEVIGADGRIDRASLARIAFVDEEKIARLERLVHPVVHARLVDEIAAARAISPRAIVIDAALLFEGGLDSRCDVTLTVDADERVRAARARVGRGWSPGELRRRQSRQIPPGEKRARATHVVRNDGERDDLRLAALTLLDEIAPGRASSTTPAETHPQHEQNTQNETEQSTDDAGR
jgi:dephospho-CoA kinase